MRIEGHFLFLGKRLLMDDALFLDLGTLNNDDTWFVAWIGNVNQHMTNGSAKIEVLLYPFAPKITISNFEGTLSQLKYWQSRSRTIDTGLLAAITLGSIVKKDKIIAPAAKYLKSETFDINLPKGFKEIKPIKDFANGFKDNTDEKDEKYQYATFDFPVNKNQNSKCLILPRDIHGSDKYDYVLIPCVELFRFYFATSSRLAQVLFNGGLQRTENDLFFPELITSDVDLQEGVLPYVYLRKEMLDDDASIIGRIAYSSDAMSAAKRAYNVIRRDKANQVNVLNPECHFPFSGQSRLKVCGRTITAAESNFKDKRLFLVYNLLTCSGSFPFTELEFDRANSGEQGENKDDPNLPKGGWKNTSNEPPDPSKPPGIKSGEAPNHNAKKVLIQDLQQRFTTSLTVRKVKKILQKTKGSSGATPPPPEPEFYTTDLESSDNPAAGTITFSSFQKNNPPEIPKQVLHSQDEYEKWFRGLVNKFLDKGLNAEYLSEDNSGYMYLDPSIYDTSTDEYKWSSEEYNRRTRDWLGRRRVLIARITDSSKKQFHMFDWVKRKNESSGGQVLFLNRELQPISQYQVKQVLSTCSSNIRIWLHDYQMKEFERKLFDHNFKYGVESTFLNLSNYLRDKGYNI